jgi:hypothetical protein
MTADYKQLSKELYEALKKVKSYLSSSGNEYFGIGNVLEKYEQETTRGKGRTTILYHKAIAEALANPGKDIEFIDHHPHNWDNAKFHKERLDKIIEKLGLDIIVHTKGRAQVYLYNKFER